MVPKMTILRALVYILGLYPSLSAGQQVYSRTTGMVQRPTCASNLATLSPSLRFSPFSFTQTETVRTATPLQSPASSARYAPSYSSNSSSGPVSTSWGNWSPGPAAGATSAAGLVPNNGGSNGRQRYGNDSWSSLWADASLVSFTRGLYSSTVSPTPVPSSELVFPPPLVFGPTDCYYFPKDFIHGIAGSAGQCEGAVADQGKSPSLLEALATIFSAVGAAGPDTVPNYVTNEHYYLYKQDIKRLAAIGIKYYSFSIQWTRILPFALPGTPINQPGLDHYNDLINFVLSQGMIPVATLTHFDTPLQFYGGSKVYLQNYLATKNYYGVSGISFGYQNETFEDAYVNYAKIVMAHYADRVPIWNTFNEPQLGCSNGKAVNSVIKAHARIYHYYKDELKGTGRVSMKMGAIPGVPLDPRNGSHVRATLIYNDLYLGTFLDTLVLGKDYPKAFKGAVQDYVPLSRQDLQYINNTLDFVAADLYETAIIYPAVTDYDACARDNSTNNPYYRYPICLQMTTKTQQGWAYGYSTSLEFHDAPSYTRTQLNYLWNTYKKPLVISEFGQQVPPPPTGRLEDNLYNIPQSQYILGHLGEVLKSIWEDGVNVIGAFVWNWGDDWEFGPLDTGFGLQYVNHSSQERRYRRSFFDYIDYIQSRTQQS